MRVNKCVSLGVAEAEYLNNHEEINLSELVRKMVKKLMNGGDEN